MLIAYRSSHYSFIECSLICAWYKNIRPHFHKIVVPANPWSGFRTSVQTGPIVYERQAPKESPQDAEPDTRRFSLSVLLEHLYQPQPSDEGASVLLRLRHVLEVRLRARSAVDHFEARGGSKALWALPHFRANTALPPSRPLSSPPFLCYSRAASRGSHSAGAHAGLWCPH